MIACRLFGDNPLPEPMMVYCQVNLRSIFQRNCIWNSKDFIQDNTYKNVVCKNGAHLVSLNMLNSWQWYKLSRLQYIPWFMPKPNVWARFFFWNVYKMVESRKHFFHKKSWFCTAGIYRFVSYHAKVLRTLLSVLNCCMTCNYRHQCGVYFLGMFLVLCVEL